MELSMQFLLFLLGVGTTVLWFSILRYRNLYGITLIKNDVVMNCVNFGITVTNTFDKNHQKTIWWFCCFPCYLIVWPTKWPQIWPHPNNITWGVPDHVHFMSFCVWPLLLPQKTTIIFFFAFSRHRHKFVPTEGLGGHLRGKLKRQNSVLFKRTLWFLWTLKCSTSNTSSFPTPNFNFGFIKCKLN